MKLINRIAATTLTTAALIGFGAGGIASAAEAAPAPDSTVTVEVPLAATQPVAGDEMSAQSTRRFTITNLSGYSLRLDNFSSQARQDNDELPQDGTIVKPGDALPIEATYYFFADNRFMAFLSVVDSNDNTVGHLTVRFKLDGLSIPTSDSPQQDGPVVVDAEGYGIQVSDRDAHTYTVNATDPERQTDLLNNFCSSGAATCKFQLAGQPEKTYGQPHPVGKVIENRTSQEGTLTVADKDVVATTNSFSLSSTIKENVLDVIDVSVTATYGHSVVRTHDFTVTSTIKIAPHTKNWMEVKAPVIRYKGDFTIKAGKSTWLIKGWSMDSPDDSRVPTESWNESPLTDQAPSGSAGIIETDTPASDMVG
jgi:hypothetical protein